MNNEEYTKITVRYPVRHYLKKSKYSMQTDSQDQLEGDSVTYTYVGYVWFLELSTAHIPQLM